MPVRLDELVQLEILGVEAHRAERAAKENATIADEPPPAVYRSLVNTPRRAYALGVRLEARSPQRTVSMGWTSSERDEEPEAAPAAFLACVAQGAATTWHGGGHAWHWTQHGHA